MAAIERLAWLAIVVIALSGCATPGPYVWASQLPAQEAGSADYVIAAGDVLSVHVYGQDSMSTKAKVRSNRKISMPFLGDVVVVGKPPVGVAHEVESGLKNFINSPNVTVSVDESQPTTISVIGEVMHPGTLAVDRNSGILQALATAGGLTENASRDMIPSSARCPCLAVSLHVRLAHAQPAELDVPTSAGRHRRRRVSDASRAPVARPPTGSSPSAIGPKRASELPIPSPTPSRWTSTR